MADEVTGEAQVSASARLAAFKTVSAAAAPAHERAKRAT
jgi:hypothetical protein